MTTYYEQNKLRILEKYDANFVTLIEKQLAYYYLNRLSRIQYQLKYHFEHHEQYLDYQRDYYQQNKVRLFASRAKVVLCFCNKKIKKGQMSQHIKTDLHKKLLRIFSSNKTTNNINNSIDFIICDDDGNEIIQPKKSWYQLNKNRIAIEKINNKFKCICGAEINKYTQPKHNLSKKHIKFIEHLDNLRF